MANTLAPFGFKRVAGMGTTPTMELAQYPILNTYATQLFTGDPVQFDTTPAGNLQQGSASTTSLAGIFMGCTYVSTSRSVQVWSAYWPGSDAVAGTVVANVINDPNAVFMVQTDTNGPVNATLVGANFQYVIGSGSTLSGISGAALVGNSNNTTATLPFKLIGVVTNPPGVNGSDVTTAGNYVLVQFNNLVGRNLTGIV